MRYFPPLLFRGLAIADGGWDRQFWIPLSLRLVVKLGSTTRRDTQYCKRIQWLGRIRWRRRWQLRLGCWQKSLFAVQRSTRNLGSKSWSRLSPTDRGLSKNSGTFITPNKPPNLILITCLTARYRSSILARPSALSLTHPLSLRQHRQSVIHQSTGHSHCLCWMWLHTFEA